LRRSSDGSLRLAGLHELLPFAGFVKISEAETLVS
jgi:hypothetical protein